MLLWMAKQADNWYIRRGMLPRNLDRVCIAECVKMRALRSRAGSFPFELHENTAAGLANPQTIATALTLNHNL
jgi:hypothetical protein